MNSPAPWQEGGDPAASIALEVVDEKSVLTQTPNVLWKSVKTAPDRGVWSRHTPDAFIRPKELRRRLRGRVAGEPLPEWHEGEGGAVARETSIMRVKGALYAPQFGAVIDPLGRLFRGTIAEARYVSPSLAQLPNVHLADGALHLARPGDPPVLERGAVFVPWGARFNYGHFLLDALSGLAVIDDMNGLEAFPPVAPPLNAWQRELLGLYLGERAGLVRELPDEMVRIDDVVFTNCMDHFLHAPNAVLKLVREKVRANAARLAPHQESPRLLYLERDDEKRVMVNQDKLINLLRLRGFSIVRPETLTVAEQVKLVSRAEVIVSATGAGLTNALFAPEGAKVFEIQPSNFTSTWVRQMCELVGVEWNGYFCDSPLTTRGKYTEATLRSDVLFQYRMPLPPFFAFLSGRAAV